jgi:hypothetical protein
VELARAQLVETVVTPDPTFMVTFPHTLTAREIEIKNLSAVKKIIEQEKIDCDFTLARSIDVWCNAEAAEKAKFVYDQMVARDFEYMNDVVFYANDNAEGVSEPGVSLNK